jgi:hypothetical protein
MSENIETPLKPAIKEITDYSQKAYLVPKVNADERDEIDLDELNELLGLDKAEPFRIDQV